MLPLFTIITPKLPPRNNYSVNMFSNDVPVKPRRKKLDVPIHGATKHRSVSEKDQSIDGNYEQIKQKHSDGTKLYKKKTKEIQKLTKENSELLIKFNELEDVSVKKITKLKEKLHSVQSVNGELVKEKELLHEQHRTLMNNCMELKNQLEDDAKRKELKVCLEKISLENKDLRTSNIELTEDLNMLKTVIYRLNVQLERYQEKFHKDNSNSKDQPISNTPNENIHGHGDHDHSPVSWGRVNVHTLGPLLDAYQDNVHEKETIIHNYETEIANFTGKLKDVVRENETLHKKLADDDDCSVKLKEQLVVLRQELRMVKEQNDVLIKKCALKQDKIEEILRCYEIKVDQLKRDYAVIHEQYLKCNADLSALKEKNHSLVEAQEDFKSERQNYIPLSVHNASVNECKKWYEELKFQYEQEKLKLKENVETQTKLVSELNLKIDALSTVRQELEAKIGQLEKHIKKGETKYLELEHTLNEVQLSRSACRKQLHKVMNFAKDMVGEQETLLKALNQRNLENKAVKKIGSDMATRMDSLKSQLKNVQKSAWQELTTVEQKIQDQEILIESMREEHNQEVESLRKIIKQQEDSNILFKSENLPIPTYLLFKDKYK